ncbi:MAG TPA: nuclear transport factor 2 family protein [Dehalococcoidia bacterium]|nr:nuclear transport factor 2 family protein [Dehalococcoidia bacterium]
MQAETLPREIRQHLLRLEEEMWAANRGGHADVFRRMVADDGIAVAAFGVFDKDAVVAQVAENRIPFRRTTMEDVRVISGGPGCGIVSYRAEIDAEGEGRPLHLSVYATTVWRQHGEGWLAVLHQLTPIQGGTS